MLVAWLALLPGAETRGVSLSPAAPGSPTSPAAQPPPRSSQRRGVMLSQGSRALLTLDPPHRCQVPSALSSKVENWAGGFAQRLHRY